MLEMVESGASDKEITKHFTALYAKKGVDDANYIKKRITIYKNIAKKALEDK
jgi:hypothetical protein